jgi:hypothetical protein
MHSQTERQFIEQSQDFLRLARKEADGRTRHLNRAHALRPTLIRDSACMTSEECKSLMHHFQEFGVSYFVALHPPPKSSLRRHPLFDIAEQLSPSINFSFPLQHPLESHPETMARYGSSDQTVKVYNLPKKDEGYREQGETSEMFEMHHDGLGSAGAVENIILYMDSAPLWGGFTYFQNISLLSLHLEKIDSEAFENLFLPDALTVVRPRGKGAIKVTTPVLYINESGRAQSVFRRASGEYVVHWRNDPALLRAKEFLELYTEPFTPGSVFVNFTATGHGCIIRNDIIAHGRTDFVDGLERQQSRVLSRKWFMRSQDYADYRHVPGLSMLPEYAGLFPHLFGRDKLEGEWIYVPEKDQNVRQR